MIPKTFPLAGFLLWLAMHSEVHAGLVASEVVVVVNKASLDSRTLANHFVALRKIPSSNVIVLDNVPNAEVVTVAEFRDKILTPLLKEIDRRRLSNHVQCVAYSADFPTAIDIQSDLKPLGKLPIFITSRASINALTYFFPLTMSADPSYVMLDGNRFARREMSAFFSNPHGKLTEIQWTTIQEKIAAGEHAEAAQLLVEMLSEYPRQYPIAYLAAAEFAQADKLDQAMEMLEKAVALGWNAGGYLKSDDRFANCRSDSRFQLLLLSLDDTLRGFQPSVGFDTQMAWTTNGVALTDTPQKRLGDRYLMSIVLGVTRGAGTTLKEAVQVLNRAAVADYTHPSCGFYFCLTSDVRTTTRKPGFEEAIASLKELGHKAEVVSEMLPAKRQDIMGAMLGTANFDWSKSHSTMLPGAIAENLTSVGAVMNSLGGQTKLTELLKAGAAGSCGTVTEPYALQQKFPHPQLYVHYARGLSLVESFYASVTGPYQLLIMGDPLCQPFASPPRLDIDTQMRILQPNDALKVPIKLETTDEEGQDLQTAMSIRLIFDDYAVEKSPIRPVVEVKLVDQLEGYHTLRIVLYGDDATSQKREVEIPVWIGDPKQAGIKLSVPKSVKFKDRKLDIQCSANNAKRFRILHDSEVVGELEGSEGEISIALDSVGTGPVRLYPMIETEDSKAIRGEPITVLVQP